MQATRIAALAALAPGVAATSSEVTPIAKVLDMLSGLHGQIVKEGEVVQREYESFAEWCEDRSRDLGFELKTGRADKERQEATISETAAEIGSLETKVEELAADISSNEADLDAATKLRKREAKDYSAEEHELVDTLDMLERATGILEKEAQKGSASLVQLQSAGNLAQALTVMVQASLIGSSDAAGLTSFVQSFQKNDDDDDDDAGAPAAATYKSHTGTLIETLQDLTEKAESQLAEVRKKESNALQNFNLLRQSLQDEMKFAEKDMAEAKKSIASSSETKSKAEGDLQVTTKELKEDNKAKATLHHDCMTKAEAFEAQVKSRAEELKAISDALRFIKENVAGAGAGAASFLQVKRASTNMEESEGSSHSEVARFVRDLAHQQHSRALMQLASQITSSANSGNGDVFDKVKGLISDMISRLMDAGSADAAKKEYCDREMGDAQAKKDDNTDEITKLSTRIEQMGTKSAMLRQEVGALQGQLAKLAQSQAKMDGLRQEEKTEFDRVQAELTQGLRGVKAALNSLSEYYASGDKAHTSSDGAGGSIIGLLEVIEADMSKELAEITSDEQAAINEYKKTTDENAIERTMKVEDTKHKTKEAKELDKSISEQTSDRTGVRAELSAVSTYLSKLKEECIAKPDTYEERAKRRAAEIRGLKEALDILENESSFIQTRLVRRTLRGGRAVSAA